MEGNGGDVLLDLALDEAQSPKDPSRPKFAAGKVTAEKGCGPDIDRVDQRPQTQKIQT